jgi:hypothetical protein
MRIEENISKSNTYVGRQNGTHSTNHTDEIDLLELFIKIYDIIQRRYRLLIAITALGILLGGSYYQWKAPVYKSYLIGTSDVLNVEQIKYLIDNLKLHLENNGAAALATALHLEENEASNIVDINVLEKDAEEKNTFYLEISRSSNESLEKYQEGITSYFENNSFVKTRVNLKKESIRELIVSLKIEEAELNKMNAIIKDNIAGHLSKDQAKGSIFNLYVPDITEVSKQKVLLKEKELELTKEFNLLSGIQIIQGFNNYNNPSNQWNMKSVGIIIMMSVVMSIMLVFMIEFLKLIKAKKGALNRVAMT